MSGNKITSRPLPPVPAEYPPSYIPHSPPTNLDDLVRGAWREPEFRDRWRRRVEALTVQGLGWVTEDGEVEGL